MRRWEIFISHRLHGSIRVICGWSVIGYCVVQDVSSITNDVCSEESSVPRK